MSGEGDSGKDQPRYKQFFSHTYTVKVFVIERDL